MNLIMRKKRPKKAQKSAKIDRFSIFWSAHFSEFLEDVMDSCCDFVKKRWSIIGPYFAERAFSFNFVVLYPAEFSILVGLYAYQKPHGAKFAKRTEYMPQFYRETSAYFWLAIHASMRSLSTSRGSAPESR